jgi:hypothetical protein
MLALLLASALVGLHTPSRNITCVDTGPSLICNVRQASYTAKLQQRCMAPPTSLDWHGFELSAHGKGQVACSGGVLVMGNVRYTTVSYGTTWRHGAYTCVSRASGLTCRNRARHGVFISRAAYRLF